MKHPIVTLCVITLCSQLLCDTTQQKPFTNKTAKGTGKAHDKFIKQFLTLKQGGASTLEAIIPQNTSQPSLIMQAAKAGSKDALIFLLNQARFQGPEILEKVLKYTDKKNNSVLIAAVEGGFTGIVELLLSYDYVKEHLINKPRLNEKGLVEESPLSLASKKKHSRNVRLLAKHGANVNFQNHESKTPFMRAIQAGEFKMAKKLAELGADINDKSTPGITSLIWAILKGSPESLSFLLELNGISIDQKDEDGNTAFAHAALQNNEEALRALAQHKANMNVKNKAGNSPLIAAAKDERWDTVFLLAQLGADSNSLDRNGNTALMIALQQKKPAIAKKLIKNYKVDTTTTNKKLLSPILIAAHNKDWETAILLAQNKGNINSVDTTGMTPLLMAAGSARPATIQQLLDLGANPRITTKKDTTALMIAIESKQWDNAALLTKKTDLINLQDTRGMTALMLAVQQKHIPTIKKLLEQKAKVDVTNKKGETAEQLAQDNEEIKQLLTPKPEKGSESPTGDSQNDQAGKEPEGPAPVVESAQEREIVSSPEESNNTPDSTPDSVSEEE